MDFLNLKDFYKLNNMSNISPISDVLRILTLAVQIILFHILIFTRRVRRKSSSHVYKIEYLHPTKSTTVDCILH